MSDYGNNIGIVPLTEAAWISQEFKPGKHYGIDIGWHAVPNCDVLAWQEGKVVGKGYYSDTGYWVALQHDYSNNKYRWTCYIHLHTTACVNVGDKVAFGQKIGLRGNTGRSTGTHLHFYLTKEMSAKQSFSYSALKANAVDPVPYCYYDKKYNNLYIAYNYWKKPLPEPIVQPVERDITKDQLTVHVDNLRVRKAPTLSGERVGFLDMDKIYNYYDVTEADGYKWYKLADDQWTAGIEELEILPKIEPARPVERDERLDQLICHYDKLRIRTKASLSGDFIAFLEMDKYYNYNETTEADGYRWYAIDKDQWVAKIDELEILPAIREYTVQEGDTLESIADNCNITLHQLLEMNPQLIKTGDILRIR